MRTFETNPAFAEEFKRKIYLIIISFGVIQADDYDATVAIARESPPGHPIENREFTGYA